jgi:hypothetical protein
MSAAKAACEKVAAVAANKIAKRVMASPRLLRKDTEEFARKQKD